MRTNVLKVAAVSALALGISFKVMASDKATKPLMQSVYVPMAELFPLSLDHKTFTHKDNKAKIESLLFSLSSGAGAISQHGDHERNAIFKYVANSLARDARDTYRWYKQGWYDEARFTLQNMTENCISCHSRVKGGDNFPGSEQFLAKVNLTNVSELEQAKLHVVTRQFDKALATYEEVFLTTSTSPSIIVNMDAFTDYLKIALRVKSDSTRLVKFLEKFLRRKDIPRHIQTQLVQWNNVLRSSTTQTDLGTPTLKKARRYLDNARTKMEYPRDRSGLVEFVLASSILNQILEDQGITQSQKAETYYYLGLTETLLRRSYWLSQQEFYLEASIRLAPEAAFAMKAYRLLEEETIAGYTGSGGTLVPEDVQATLDELRALIEAHPKQPKKS